MPELGADDRIRGGRNRELVIVRNVRRKLFNRARKKTFLDFFAATANLGWAAEKADISRQTISKHLVKDSEFAAAYREALDVGRLRLEAKLLETKKPEAPLFPSDGAGSGADGTGDGDEIPDIDMEFDKALAVFRELGREVKVGRKQGAPARVASNDETLKELTKRVRAMWVRAERRHGRDGSAAPPPPEEDEDGAKEETEQGAAAAATGDGAPVEAASFDVAPEAGA